MLRLFALPFADNPQSIRVLEKAGYTREGILRSSSVKYGAVRDQALYALVNPAWKGVRRMAPALKAHGSVFGFGVERWPARIRTLGIERPQHQLSDLHAVSRWHGLAEIHPIRA